MTPKAALIIAAALTAIACGSPTPSGKPIRQAAAEESPSPSPVTHTPAVTEFTIAVTIIKRSCFGDAGCNVEYRIAPTYSGLPLDESQEWLVTYSINGGEDGPQINNFTMRGDTASFNREEYIQTKAAKTPLTATVTAVAPN